MYNQDQLIVRELAKEYRELVNTERVLKLKDEWIAFNELKENARPLVMTFPDNNSWSQIVPDESLKCTDPRYKGYERTLRKQLVGLKDIKDDTPYTATFGVRYDTQISGYGKELNIIANKSGEPGGSYHYEKLINDITEEFYKLEYRTITHDKDSSEKSKNIAEETLGDILKVEYRGEQWWTLGITWEVIKLIGLEDLMINMYDDPDGLHQLMAWFTKEHLNLMSQAKKLQIINPNDTDIPIGSGGFGWTTELRNGDFNANQNIDYMQKWGFSESQETVGISPDMFAEFIFPYQLPLLEKFGLNSYGCCEPIEGRWKWVKEIPRLRRVSVSPWADIHQMKDILKKDYIYSRKVNPSYLCVGNDEEMLRKEIADVVAFSKDVNLEIIMKDISTLQNDPQRLFNWVKMAREELEKVR
ncbi:MAG: hypothetical protein R3Y33_04035 [Clostridia bacterium]